MKQLSYFRLSAVSLFIICFTLLSCSPKYENVYVENWDDLAGLPEDTGGEHIAFGGQEFPGAGNGMYVYLPGGWETSPVDYPTIFFFHGAGEVGNSKWNKDNLTKVLKNGIPRMIEAGEWDPPVPFIVISPQSQGAMRWHMSFTDEFLEELYNRYPINISRIYYVGLSMGGSLVWFARKEYGNKFLSAAGVTVSTSLWIGHWDITLEGFQKKIPGYPLWEFHGEKDRLCDVTEIKDAIAGINNVNKSFPVKLTIFPELNHSCWEEVFTSKMDTLTDLDYDFWDMDIYSWLLHHRRVEK